MKVLFLERGIDYSYCWRIREGRKRLYQENETQFRIEAGSIDRLADEIEMLDLAKRLEKELKAQIITEDDMTFQEYLDLIKKI